jgi:DNA repair protein RecO (recombination protein O)
VSTEHTTAGLVLHTRAFGESDRIVTLLTEHFGKLAGIAKGARNSRRRFAGTLEPFVQVRVVFRQRSETTLAFLERCEFLNVFARFTEDLGLFGAGSYVLELTDRMVLGREAGPNVFRLVRQVFELLDGGTPPDPVLRAFELHLLAITGYAPAFDRCRGCGAPTSIGPIYLAIERGGIVCRTCGQTGEPVRPIATATAAACDRLARGRLDEANRLPGESLLEAGRVAEHLLAQVLTAPLKTRAFLERMRVDSRDGLR